MNKLVHCYSMVSLNHMVVTCAHMVIRQNMARSLELQLGLEYGASCPT